MPGRIYLDNPGGTQVHGSVIEAVTDYYVRANANLDGPFETLVPVGRVIDEAAGRRRGVPRSGGARGDHVRRQHDDAHDARLAHHCCAIWAPGDEVLVTGLDHDANIAPWLLAAEDRGVTIRQAGIDLESCLVDMDDFAAKLSDRTRVAAFGWASNGGGTVSEVGRMTAMAREAGAVTYVDAVHFGPHGPIDVTALGHRLPGVLGLHSD